MTAPTLPGCFSREDSGRLMLCAAGTEFKNDTRRVYAGRRKGAREYIIRRRYNKEYGCACIMQRKRKVAPSMSINQSIRLTELASCAGCAAKIGADTLAQVLRPLRQRNVPPQLLVGLGAIDDAAVYKANDQQAIISTADFFPPVVDDPYTFGSIAAANALSDVYAMGGQVLMAINLVA